MKTPSYNILFRGYFTFLLFILSSDISSQELNLRFRHFSAGDGLTIEKPFCMLQSKDGYMWFGTLQGISRFDGMNFKVYNAKGSNENSLKDPKIIDMVEDAEGQLWLASSRGGLHRFDPSTETFFHYPSKPLIPTLSNVNLKKLYLDKNQDLWLGTNGQGLMKFDKETASFETFLLNPLKNTFGENRAVNTVLEILEDREDENILWLGSLNGLYKFNKKTHELEHFFQKAKTEKIELFFNMLASLGQTKSGEIWIGSRGGGLIQFDEKTKEWKNYFPNPKAFEKQDFSENKILDIEIKSNNELWVAVTDLGLGIFNYDTKTFQFFKKNKYNLFSNKEGTANRILEGRDGIIWVLTGAGISMIDPIPNHFKTYIFPEFEKRNFYEDTPSDFLWDDATQKYYISLHAGTGVLVLDKNFKIEKVIKSEDWEGEETDLFYVLKGNDERIWVLGHGRIYQIGAGGKLISYYKKKEFNKLKYPNYSATTIFKHSSGLIYIGTEGGGLIEINGEKIKQYATDEKNNFYSSTAIVSIVENKDKTIWLATNMGLYHFNPETKETNYYYSKSPSLQLLEDQISALCFDNKGHLWLAYQTAGIQLLDIGNLKPLPVAKQLSDIPKGLIVKMLLDQKGRVWIGGSRFLSSYDPSTKLVYNFGLREGSDRSKWASGLSIMDNGWMFSGIGKGFQYFHPDTLLKSEFSPNVKIQQVDIFDEELKSAAFKKEIYLPYDSNSVAIHFGLLNFSNTHRNKFSYILENLEYNWHHTNSNDRKAVYNALPPGDYIFKLKGANYLGEWNEKPVELKISILPPWWQTYWFYGICLLGFMGIVYGIFRYRVNQVNQGEQHEIQLNELEHKALKAQMNPHFIFNCLNSIKLLIQNEQNEEAINYLSKFSKLIRKVLQFSEKKEISLFQELEIAKLYLKMEELRFEGKFKFDVIISSEVDTSFYFIPQMILQPYLENAIWHGLLHLESSGKLILKIDKVPNGFLCIIDDNGIGRVKSEQLKSKSARQHKSMGMTLTENRLELAKKMTGKDIKVSIIDKVGDNGNGLGTTVELLFIDI